MAAGFTIRAASSWLRLPQATLGAKSRKMALDDTSPVEDTQDQQKKKRRYACRIICEILLSYQQEGWLASETCHPMAVLTNSSMTFKPNLGDLGLPSLGVSQICDGGEI